MKFNIWNTSGRLTILESTVVSASKIYCQIRQLWEQNSRFTLSITYSNETFFWYLFYCSRCPIGLYRLIKRQRIGWWLFLLVLLFSKFCEQQLLINRRRQNQHSYQDHVDKRVPLPDIDYSKFPTNFKSWSVFCHQLHFVKSMTIIITGSTLIWSMPLSGLAHSNSSTNSEQSIKLDFISYWKDIIIPFQRNLIKNMVWECSNMTSSYFSYSNNSDTTIYPDGRVSYMWWVLLDFISKNIRRKVNAIHAA